MNEATVMKIQAIAADELQICALIDRTRELLSDTRELLDCRLDRLEAQLATLEDVRARVGKRVLEEIRNDPVAFESPMASNRRVFERKGGAA